MNKQKRIDINEFFRVSALIFLLILMIYIAFSSVFNPYELDISRYSYLKKDVVIIGNILSIITFIIGIKILSGLKEKNRLIVMCILGAMMIIAQVICALCIQNIPDNDLCHITAEAQRMLEDFRLHNIEYYGKYPNNLPLLMIVYGIYRFAGFFGIENANLFASFINIIFVDAAMLLMCFTAKKIGGQKLFLIALIACVFNPLVYVYIPYYYTDTFSMPFFAGIMYIVVKIEKDDLNIKSRICYMTCLGMLTGIGMLIRPTIIITVIALVMYSFFLKRFKKNIPYMIAAIIGVVVINIGYNGAISKFTDMNYINKELKFPTIHWIMMGLGSDGTYNVKDMEFTFNAGNIDEKKKADTEVLKERFKEKGIIKTVEHCIDKTRITWSGGTGAFYKKLRNARKDTYTYNYLIGNQNKWFVYYCIFFNSIFRMGMLIALIYYIFARKGGSTDFLFTVITGAILFYWLWEAGSRYSVCFMPFTLLIMAYGFSRLNDSINAVSQDNEKNIRKIYVGVAGIVVVLQIVLLVFIYNVEWIRQLSARQEIVRDVSDTVSKDKIMSQTFTPTLPFDKVSVWVNNTGNDITCNYILRLKNEHGDTLASNEYISSDASIIDSEGEVISSNVTDDTELTLDFDKVTPHDNEKYEIELSTNDREGNLVIDGTKDGEFKLYLDGNSYINNEISDNFSWKFEAYTVKQQYVVNPVIYGIICILTDACFIIFIRTQRRTR